MSTNIQKSGKVNKNSNTRTSNFFIGLLSTLAIILAGSGIGLGYFTWLKINKELDAASVDRQSIAHEITTIDENARLQSFKKQIHHSLETFENKLTELKNQLDLQADLQEKIYETSLDTVAYVNRSQLIWGLKEAEHVLRMANHNLQIENDISGAIAAMQTADNRLVELNDIRLEPLRDSISNQVKILNNFPYPDLIGLRLNIDRLLVDLRRSLISSIQFDEGIQKFDEPKNEDYVDLSWWSRLLTNLKNLFSSSVTVSNEKQKMKLFIAQQEKQQAYEFLRMKLLGAKYSIASHDDKTYHRELEAALAWLNNSNSIKHKKELIHDLNELNSINIEPDLPDISEPYILLNDIFDKIESN